jgi:hypothetical protein
VKCSEVLQCSDGPSNKVSNSIGRHTDNMKWLLIYSLGSIFYQCICGCIPLYYCNLCVFIVMSICFIVCLCIFIVPAGTLWLPWLRFFRAFPSVVRQMPGYNSQRWDTGRTKLPIFLCCSMYCLFLCCSLFVCFVSFCVSCVCKCVLYYCHRLATQLQLRNISYHIIS